MSTNPRASNGGVDKKKRTFHGPVAWLLGRQLLASLKGTLLYTAFGSKLDARDWMRAEEYPTAEQDSSEQKWREQLNDTNETVTARDFWRKEQKEFWFDYIADTGDGMRATYSIAYLCLSDLLAEVSNKPSSDKPSSDTPHLSRYEESLKFMAHPDAPRTVSDEYQNADLNCTDVMTGKELRLPRGQFLLVGGDTTYHLSDYEGLHTRFQTPFDWAFDDIRADKRLWKDEGKSWDKLRRPLFGIPGNHDYYDQLDGFRRQFHRPVRKDEEPPKDRPFDAPPLMIKGFMRCQRASYVALRLPFDWLLWALDTEVGEIDRRQRKFFRDIKVKGGLSTEEGGKPAKLIVATCAPTTVFGKYADKDDEKSAKAFYQLELPRPFLNPDPDKTGKEDGPTELEAGQCRLDLSGDVHHYARYWGTKSVDNPRNDKKPEENSHYASVVSGLGGAFHHPSTTYAGEISEQVLYPSVKTSREEVAGKIFNPVNIMRGGGVWAIGFMLAFLIFFAANISNSSSQAVTNFWPLVKLGISDWTPITPTVSVETNLLNDINKKMEVQRHWPMRLFNDEKYSLVLSDDTRALYEKPPEQNPCFNKYVHFWGKCTVQRPPTYWLGLGLAALSLGLYIYLFWFSERIYEKYRKYEEVRMKTTPPENGQGKGGEDKGTKGEPASKLLSKALDVSKTMRGEFVEKEQTTEWYESLMLQFSIPMYLAVITSILALYGAILIFEPYRPYLTPYGNSLMVMLTLGWAVMAVILVLRYSDWLSLMASKITIKSRHWLLVWALSIAAVLGIIFGFALFGLYNTASDLVTDILLMMVFLAVFAGLTVLGAIKIKELTKGWKWGLFGMALGLFHALIQFSIPYLLVRKGNGLAWLIWLGLMIVMPFAGWRLMKNNMRKLLLVAWLFFGTLLLVLPHVAFYISKPASESQSSFLEAFKSEDGAAIPLLSQLAGQIGIKSEREGVTSDWVLLWACFVAGAVGLWMSCVWLGWYMGVALLFDGHNNEAGGAAQIERFKQFIRFRLTEHDLTGFVIAVDEPKEHGSQLKLKLIDVIYLTPKKEA